MRDSENAGELRVHHRRQTNAPLQFESAPPSQLALFHLDRKWTRELHRLEKLQKDQREAAAIPKKRVEQPEKVRVQRKSAPATGGYKPGHPLFVRRGGVRMTADLVRKTAPADSVKAPPREPYKAERSEMDAYGMKPKDRVRQRSPPRKPKETGAGSQGGDQGAGMRGTAVRTAGTSGSRGVSEKTDTTRVSGGGYVGAGKTAAGATIKGAGSKKSPNGMLDRWLGKGAKGQPQKKQRREEASLAGGCDVERRAVASFSGEGRRNEAPTQKEKVAAARDGAAVKELLTKQRRRVIEEDDDSDDEDSPMVVKRRRVETETESAELGRGLETERSAEGVSGRTGDRKSSGTAAERDQERRTEGARLPKGDSRISSQKRSDVTDARRAPGVAVVGRDRQADRPIKTALTEITNRGVGAEPASKPAGSKELPRGTSSGAVPEDLLETQRVVPLTQMGDSEDPLEEDALPDNPVRFPPSFDDPGGHSKGSLRESEWAPGGLVGVGLGEKRAEETAGRETGPSGTRPFDLNEHSSAGPATGTGRKSIASGKEATSGNTGSFRGTQVRAEGRWASV